MINPETIFEILKDNNFKFFCGVPDSLLKNFCSYISDKVSSENHIIAANEGNAIALATGYYLGTGSPGLVYMQNSGFGNALNPILSLADREVYQIPMLLFVGWRGKPGIKDEPQHIKQGRVMNALLDSIEIPWFILNAESNYKEILEKSIEKMNKRNCPVAILVEKNTFKNYESISINNCNNLEKRETVIGKILASVDHNCRIVSTTGVTSRELYECRKTRNETIENDFLTVGSMGHASSIVLGLALTTPEKKIICLDGDGSLLMHMGAISLIGQSNMKNIIHIILNNGAHDSVGGQPTVALDLNLPAIFYACGYKKCISIDKLDLVSSSLSSLIKEDGPTMLEIQVSKGFRNNLGRPESSPLNNRISFMRSI